MKRIFISILGVAMFAACAKTGTEEVIPVDPKPEEEVQSVYVEIGATTGNETKATYDAALKAYWEVGDQILAVQGHACDWKAGGNDKTVYADKLILQSGDHTNSAVFAGSISTQTSNAKYFHFAYPATNTVLSTHGKINAINTSNTQTATCTYTVTAGQDGKWTPFLCASTTEKTTAANITDIDFGTSLNACFAVRVFENDKTTPKKIKSITITAANDIIGTMTATTANDGAFSADMFTINGGGNTITADNLQDIETLGGLYEYRFEVLPTDAGIIELAITDEAGSEIRRQTSAKTFRANTRSGVNVYWDEATITMDKPLSWYEDTTGDHLSALASKAIYVKNVNISGVGIDGISEAGVYVNGEYAEPKPNKALQFDMQIVAPVSGEYIIEPYAILANGTEIKGAGQTVTVTDKLEILSHNIRSSYNSNDEISKTNDINGDIIMASYSLNDSYADANLIKSIKFISDEISADMEAGKTFTSAGLAPQAYSNSHIVIEFGNGYTLNTPAYTINVTGVPYSITANSATPAGWSTSNTTESSGKLLIKDGGYAMSPAFYASSECSYSVNASAQVYCYRGSLTSATYTLSMQTDPAGNASLSENLSGGTNTGNSSSTKSIYPDFHTDTRIRIGSKKVKTGGFSAIPHGIRVHSLSVRYNL